MLANMHKPLGEFAEQIRKMDGLIGPRSAPRTVGALDGLDMGGPTKHLNALLAQREGPLDGLLSAGTHKRLAEQVRTVVTRELRLGGLYETALSLQSAVEAGRRVTTQGVPAADNEDLVIVPTVAAWMRALPDPEDRTVVLARLTSAVALFSTINAYRSDGLGAAAESALYLVLAVLALACAEADRSRRR